MHAIIALEERSYMASTVTPSVSDIVRNHIRDVYVKSAVQRGERFVRVKAGTVHKALALTNRVPLVCEALKSRKLLDENHLRLVSQTGPPSGQSTTVTFTYEILEPQAPPSHEALLALRGIAKDVFQKLGGGEPFIRSERQSFATSSAKREEPLRK
jgi:hypothetical protein